MESFSIIIPVVMVFVFVTMIVMFCVCVYKRRMLMNNQRPCFAPTYTTNTMAATYPNQSGFINTAGSPHTAGYPHTTGYPSQLHVNHGIGFSGYSAPPPAYGDCVGTTHHDFSSKGYGMSHGSTGMGFDNMGSSFNTGGGADFGSSFNTGGGGGFSSSSNTCGGGDFGGSSNTGGGMGSSSCGGDAF